jgi:hypothetical protein
MAADDALEAVDARELSVAADVLRDTAVDCLADLVDTRAGIAVILSPGCRNPACECCEKNRSYDGMYC